MAPIWTFHGPVRSVSQKEKANKVKFFIYFLRLFVMNINKSGGICTELTWNLLGGERRKKFGETGMTELPNPKHLFCFVFAS